MRGKNVPPGFSRLPERGMQRHAAADRSSAAIAPAADARSCGECARRSCNGVSWWGVCAKKHHERRGGGRRSCAPVLRGCVRQQHRGLRGERTASGRARRSSSVPPSRRRRPLPLTLRFAGSPRARGCPTGPAQAAERFAGNQWFAAQVAVMQTVEGRFGRLHLCFHGVPLVALVDRNPLLTRRCEAGRP
jgi:hypothetical protein